jgi:hypothetical protein
LLALFGGGRFLAFGLPGLAPGRLAVGFALDGLDDNVDPRALLTVLGWLFRLRGGLVPLESLARVRLQNGHGADPWPYKGIADSEEARWHQHVENEAPSQGSPI